MLVCAPCLQLKAQQVARAKLCERIVALSSELVGWRARIGRVRGQWEDMQALNAQLRADNASMAAAIQQKQLQLGTPCAPVHPDPAFARHMAPMPMPHSAMAAAAAHQGPPGMFPLPGFSVPVVVGGFQAASPGMMSGLSPPTAGMAPMAHSRPYSNWEQQQEPSMRRSSSCGGSSGLQEVPWTAPCAPAYGPRNGYMLPRSSSGPYLGPPALQGPTAATLSCSYSAPAALAAAQEAVVAPWEPVEADTAAAAAWVPAAATASQPSSACGEVSTLAPWEVLPPCIQAPSSAQGPVLVKQLSSNSSATTGVYGDAAGVQGVGGVSPSDDPLDLLLADDTCWGSESLEELMGLLAEDKATDTTSPMSRPTGGYIIPAVAPEPPACLVPDYSLEPTCSPLSGGSSITGCGLPPPAYNCLMDSWSLPVAPMSSGLVFV
jgi:hypothetical protein